MNSKSQTRINQENIIPFQKGYDQYCTMLLQKGNDAFHADDYYTSSQLYAQCFEHAQSLLHMTKANIINDYDHNIALMVVSGKNLAESYTKSHATLHAEQVMQEVVDALLEEADKVRMYHNSRMCLLYHLKHATSELLHYANLTSQPKERHSLDVVEASIDIAKTLLPDIEVA